MVPAPSYNAQQQASRSSTRAVFGQQNTSSMTARSVRYPSRSHAKSAAPGPNHGLTRGRPEMARGLRMYPLIRQGLNQSAPQCEGQSTTQSPPSKERQCGGLKSELAPPVNRHTTIGDFPEPSIIARTAQEVSDEGATRAHSCECSNP